MRTFIRISMAIIVVAVVLWFVASVYGAFQMMTA